MSPWDRAGRRMNYAKGNTESKYTLMTPRTYGEPALLDLDLSSPPSLNDINSQPAAFKDRYWSAPIFRIGVIAIAYCEYNTSDIVIYKMNTHLILILVIHITFYLLSFYILHLQLHFLCSLKCSTTFELWTLMILIPLLAKLPQMVRTFVPQIR